jgi:uncharacterized membrane protein (UPF0127 family)
MAQHRTLRNAETGAIILNRARWCESFWSHFVGLQLAPPLPDDEGLLFVTGRENRAQTTIHMFFMRFSIGVVWLDGGGVVVDRVFAKPWRPAYAPAKPARYFIEAMPGILERVQVGDRLRFDEPAQR